MGQGQRFFGGVPSGGKFALDIFREDPKRAKKVFKDMRDSIDDSTSYASKWLPENYKNNNVHVFGERWFEIIIKDTVGNNRNRIITMINSFDEIAIAASEVINAELK